MIVSNRFAGRDLWIVTQHKKETVIAPVLSRSLYVHCRVFNKLDTDQFGTFCGLKERNSALEAARAKCSEAARLLSEDLILASEGSFGPHPLLPFTPCNEELLLLKDLQSNREYKVTYHTFRTNMAGAEIETEQELKDFARKTGFPSHALMLRCDTNTRLMKGITSWTVLLNAFRKQIKEQGRVHIETDMRAMFNPTRMLAIRKAARLLARLLLSQCPCCGSPGFGISRTSPGLPCSACGTPTASAVVQIRYCEECHTEISYPVRKSSEDPMFCQLCNP